MQRSGSLFWYDFSAIQDEKIRNKEYKAVESVDDRGKLIAQITGRGDNSGLNVSWGKLYVT